MASQRSHIAQRSRSSRATDSFTLGASVRGRTLDLTLPVDSRRIDMVRLNGLEYRQKGVVKIITRVAPVKYTEEVFAMIDQLIEQGYKHRAAYEEVARGFGFEADNLGRAYRARHQNKKTRLKGGR